MVGSRVVQRGREYVGHGLLSQAGASPAPFCAHLGDGAQIVRGDAELSQ
jgi:hypothetical protein